MTRINCIPPSELSREHLIAEYKEIPRVFSLVVKAIDRGETPDDRRNPEKYVLGTGHVRFFYPRLAYVLDRFLCLVDEMRSRGYNPTYDRPPECSSSIPSQWWGTWIPDDESMQLNRKRIEERILFSKEKKLRKEIE